jgi:hypothetical protein
MSKSWMEGILWRTAKSRFELINSGSQQTGVWARYTKVKER